MPELPAVEFTKLLLQTSCIGKEIKGIEFLQEDELIFSKAAIEALKKIHRIEKVGRWGKQLWLETDKGFFLMHLGMTGFVQASNTSRLKYESSPSSLNEEKLWPPRFSKFVLKMEGGEEVVFGDARRMGRVSLSNAHSEAEILGQLQSKLGFDPILSIDYAFADFVVGLAKRRVPLKSLLLDQKFVAGVGNWMADDILLEARLSPHRLGNSLEEKEAAELLKAIRKISEVAVEAEAQKQKFPKVWLFHVRWQRGGAKETLLGQAIKQDRIAGRSTFWIPELQH